MKALCSINIESVLQRSCTNVFQITELDLILGPAPLKSKVYLLYVLFCLNKICLISPCMNIKQNARKVCHETNQFGGCNEAGFRNACAVSHLNMEAIQCHKQSSVTEGTHGLQCCRLYCALLWLSITPVLKCLCSDAWLEH